MLLLKVLAVADDFDLAVEHVPAEAQGSPWVAGIAAIDRKLRALLESEGVTAMDTVGQMFDPREHEAIASEDTTEVPDGTVVRELQRGWTTPRPRSATCPRGRGTQRPDTLSRDQMRHGFGSGRKQGVD